MPTFQMSATEKRLIHIPLYLLSFVTTCAMAGTPCDFKGVSVGDKMTPRQIMNALGVNEFKTNPPKFPFEKARKLFDKYGIIPAGEIEDWQIGAACYDSYCQIPHGVTVGNDNIPVSIYISFQNEEITEIDVSFNSTFWNEIKPIISEKFGAQWEVETDPNFLITNEETKKSYTVEREILTHKKNGTNQKSGDVCQIWAANYDIIQTHHDPLGAFHATFVIKLVSKNF